MTTLITVFCIYFIYRLCNFNLFNIMIQLSFRLFITYTHCTLCTVFRAYKLGTYYICHGYNYYPRNYVPLHVLDITYLKSNMLGGIQSFYKPLPTNCACCKRSMNVVLLLCMSVERICIYCRCLLFVYMY